MKENRSSTLEASGLQFIKFDFMIGGQEIKIAILVKSCFIRRYFFSLICKIVNLFAFIIFFLF